MWSRSPGNRRKACLLESPHILCKSHRRDRRQELPVRRGTPDSPTQHRHYPPLGRRKKAHSFTRSYSGLKKNKNKNKKQKSDTIVGSNSSPLQTKLSQDTRKSEASNKEKQKYGEGTGLASQAGLR